MAQEEAELGSSPTSFMDAGVETPARLRGGGGGGGGAGLGGGGCDARTRGLLSHAGHTTSIRQHTLAYVSIRQHTMRELEAC